MERGFTDAEAAAEFFSSCNVVVTTMSLLGGALPEVGERIALRRTIVPFSFPERLSRLPLKMLESLRRAQRPTVLVASHSVQSVQEGLRQQRAIQQAADKLRLGAAFEDSGHIFKSPIGGPLERYKATDAFRTIRDRLKVKATLHDLRHTAPTWMLSSGIDIRSVAQVLGHTQASNTLSVYSHVLPGAEEKAVAAIDARFSAFVETHDKGNRRQP